MVLKVGRAVEVTVERPYRRTLFYATLMLLLVLNIGVWLLMNTSAELTHQDLEIPYRLGNWVGEDLTLTDDKLALLAPAQLVSRAYRPVAAGGAHQDDGRSRQTIWLNLTQTHRVGSLHNFYDSLVASGLKPVIIKTHVVQTSNGPLRTTLIRYQSTGGQPHYLLLWYQWAGGNAENRWRWYQEILALRLKRQSRHWQLVEVATSVTHPDLPPEQSPALASLEEFSRMLYEASSTPVAP